VTVVAISYYVVIDDGDEASSLTHFGIGLPLLSILCVVVIAAFIKFRQLRFVQDDDGSEAVLDQYLLVVAVFGALLLECFHFISALGTINTGGLFSILSVVASVIAFIQVSIYMRH